MTGPSGSEAKMIGRVLGGLAAIAVASAIGFGIYAWHPAIAPVARPAPDSFDPALVEKGRILAAAGYCATCHTASRDAAPYAGNYAMKTDFGTIYSSNITPDPETGIGTWSEAAFTRAMRQGIGQRGEHLFPAFPYDHFSRITDADISALYAYIMSSVPPVKAAKQANELPFPLDVRVLQAGWKLLFADLHPFVPNPEKPAEWNRGAYLAEGIAHCGACHTPRNRLGAERTDAQYEGAPIDNWYAPPLTARNPSGVPWRAADFHDYLATGATTYHGAAAGPMAPVVHAGIRQLPDSDLWAIGIYLGDIVGAAPADEAQNPAVLAALKAEAPQADYRLQEGQRLYATACASCHYNSGGIVKGRPDLGINSSTRLSDPANLIHVILDGLRADQGMTGIVMPAFGHALDDGQVAAIAAYLRATRTKERPWPDLEKAVARIRAEPPLAH
ncbi:cytochrome c [Haematobacter massiliensis]|nr:cytochrome c [Haematobacter massiliensis]